MAASPSAAASFSTSRPPASPWDPSKRTSHPIKARSKSWRHDAQLALFLFVFLSACLCTHLTQLLVWPAYFWEPTRPLYDRVINESKKCFAIVCLNLIKLFAPTSIRLTLHEDLPQDRLITSHGGKLTLTLPSQHVMISNHQVYLDWMMAWFILYFSNLHGAVIILLKNSLKWVPVLGPAMQFYDFVFMARSWEADKQTLQRSLAKMGQRATAEEQPLSLMIFPEGTLVSKDTRPLSAKFAAKQGLEDLKYSLLPRSTGLLYCLRALASKIPDLKVLDLTIGYEGIPADGYGQDYYTLASFYGAGDAPDHIHVHYKEFTLRDIPIGDISKEPSQAEKDAFGDWLLQQWRLKDALLEHFYTTGSFNGGQGVAESQLNFPVQLVRGNDFATLAISLLPGAAVVYEAFRALWRAF